MCLCICVCLCVCVQNDTTECERRVLNTLCQRKFLLVSSFLSFFCLPQPHQYIFPCLTLFCVCLCVSVLSLVWLYLIRLDWTELNFRENGLPQLIVFNMKFIFNNIWPSFLVFFNKHYAALLYKYLMVYKILSSSRFTLPSYSSLSGFVPQTLWKQGLNPKATKGKQARVTTFSRGGICHKYALVILFWFFLIPISGQKLIKRPYWSKW